jgi:hypothetical protein
MLWSENIRPLTIMSAVCTLLAVSLTVTFADRVLLTIPAPQLLYNALASFRASGRLFWPVYYLVTLAAVVGIVGTISHKPTRWVVLTLALLIQYFDGLAIRESVANEARMVHSDPLESAQWAALSRNYKHLVVLPAFQCGKEKTPGGPDAWRDFAHLAAQSGMTLNSVYVARMLPQTRALDCSTVPSELLKNGLNADTVYVVSDSMLLRVVRTPRELCRRLDGFNVCAYDRLRVTIGSS